MTKKKLLFRIGTLQSGGAERMLVDILNHLDKEKYDITLLLNVNYGIFIPEIASHIKLLHLYEFTEWPWISKYFPKVSTLIRKTKHEIYYYFPSLIHKRVLKNKKFDLVIYFLQDMADHGAKSHPNSKKWIWVHDVLSDVSMPRKASARIIQHLSHYDRVICVSNEVRDFLLERDKTLNPLLTTIPNPLDFSAIHKKASSFFPEEYTDQENTLKIVAVGRPSRQKAFERLFLLSKLLLEANIKHNIFIVGEGIPTEMKLLKSQIKESGLPIISLGKKTNPYPYIKNADILVHPSRHEGYGLVIAEALLLNTPVLTTEHDCIKEFAKDQVLYMPNDDKEFAHHVFNYIKDNYHADNNSLNYDRGHLKKTRILDISDYISRLDLYIEELCAE